MLEERRNAPFRLRFPVSQIDSWAAKYQNDAENDVSEIFVKIRKRGFLKQSELLEIAEWKSQRRARLVLNNDQDYIKDLTQFCFSTVNERSRIAPLTSLSGVGWPMASVILHFYFPDQYPILDVRALWSLRHENPPPYDFSYWWRYVEECRRLAPN